MKFMFRSLLLALLGLVFVFCTLVKKTGLLEDGVTITVPEGFSSQVFAQNMGRVRHLAVHPNGDLFAKLDRLRDGKGILRLRDTNGDGVVDDSLKFGSFKGTGIAIKGNYLYASSDNEIFRYPIDANGNVSNTEAPQRIVTGLVGTSQHGSKSIALDNSGNIYVNIGAPSNVCQEKDRAAGSKGQMPCPILEKAGGIWKFKADGNDQSYAEGTRFATGLRNVVGLDWNTEVNNLYVMQHGRDGLYQTFPDLFDQVASAESPAEEMFRLKEGSDCGWPYCYYDNDKQKKLLNPEYGGNREKEDVCADKEKSVVQFPGHMAPNGLLFYTGKQFPARYKNGAFVAFHGSWNRAPQPQAGYFVVFVPMKNGQPTGKWEVFADGFAGANINRAKYRPCGLAQAPDGSLYVSDDNAGMIWKISYKK